MSFFCSARALIDGEISSQRERKRVRQFFSRDGNCLARIVKATRESRATRIGARARPRRRVETNHRDDTGSLTRSGVDGIFFACFQRERERERERERVYKRKQEHN